ncbi:OmpA family protein, partial [Halomonas sp. AOP5-CZ2-32]
VGYGAGKLTKQDVTELLGVPNDSLATEQDNSWQYNVNLPLNDEDYLVCQYQVSFTQQILVSSEWRRPQCNRLFSELSQHAPPQILSFSADFLFEFDSYALSSQGRRELQQAVQDAQASLGGRSVLVTGHADQIGSAEYNMHLSEQRAKAVVEALIQGGGNPEKITYVGRGENDSIVSCPGLVGVSLKECLAPNRRVDILFNRNT